MLSSASDESRSTNLSASESKNLRYSNEKLKQALSQRYDIFRPHVNPLGKTRGIVIIISVCLFVNRA